MLIQLKLVFVFRLNGVVHEIVDLSGIENCAFATCARLDRLSAFLTNPQIDGRVTPTQGVSIDFFAAVWTDNFFHITKMGTKMRLVNLDHCVKYEFLTLQNLLNLALSW